MAALMDNPSATQTAAEMFPFEIYERDGWIYRTVATNRSDAKDWFAAEKKTNRMTLSQLRDWMAQVQVQGRRWRIFR